MSSLKEKIRHVKSLDELSGPPAINLQHEFNGEGSVLKASDSDRRNFLKLMGASMALAGVGVTGCRRWPEEKIAPYVNRPENFIPGESEQFASCRDLKGVGHGLLITSHDNRPTKVGGNPDIPYSTGGTNAFLQASILDLYDPDRSKHPLVAKASGKRKKSSKKECYSWIDKMMGLHDTKSGKGLSVLVSSDSSPSRLELKKMLMERFKNISWHEFDPVSNTNERDGLEKAFGKGVWKPQYSLENAEVIISFDSDFLEGHSDSINLSSGWASKRDPEKIMSRVWVLENSLTCTGMKADERIAVRKTDMHAAFLQIAHEIESTIPLGRKVIDPAVAKLIANDFLSKSGRAVILVGASQPSWVHQMASVINARFRAPVSYLKTEKQSKTISDLVSDIDQGSVETLFILGGNPAYDAPSNLQFDKALKRIKNTLHISMHDDETSQLCTWHLNASHAMECWRDARSWNGTHLIGQPLIQPLYGGVSDLEILALMSGQQVQDGFEIVRDTFDIADGMRSQSESDRRWRTALKNGYRENSRPMPKLVTPQITDIDLKLEENDGFELCFEESPSVSDGSFANNGWMQEAPDPITKLTWDNALKIAPSDAKELSLKDGDLVKIEVNGVSLEVPVIQVPGQAKRSLSIELGYGRRFNGRICAGAGKDVYPLRSSEGMWFVKTKIEKSKGSYPLATTQAHHPIDTTGGKGTQDRLSMIVRQGTLGEYNSHADFAKHRSHAPHSLSIYKESQFEEAQYKWGMVIDLNTCTGCNNCIVACQAENNIPIVGKDQVLMGREMHWLRMDRYYEYKEGDDIDNPSSFLTQPIACFHCENAPCETVCPVAATVHDSDGLNSMVYNRCIGTRYCSNNCPIKVRRFNYFDYFRREPLRSTGMLQVQPTYYRRVQSTGAPIRRMQFNPNVTVRMRGVMEKCTFCVQRISKAKIETKNAWVKLSEAEKKKDPRVTIPDGTIKSACQDCCPTGAVIFGDLLDPNSRVSKASKNPRAYALLDELNIKSRTKYLASVTNPIHDTYECDHDHHGGHGNHDYGGKH